MAIEHNWQSVRGCRLTDSCPRGSTGVTLPDERQSTDLGSAPADAAITFPPFLALTSSRAVQRMGGGSVCVWGGWVVGWVGGWVGVCVGGYVVVWL